MTEQDQRVSQVIAKGKEVKADDGEDNEWVSVEVTIRMFYYCWTKIIIIINQLNYLT